MSKFKFLCKLETRVVIESDSKEEAENRIKNLLSDNKYYIAYLAYKADDLIETKYLGVVLN